MPKDGFQSINVKEGTYDRVQKYCKLHNLKPSQLLQDILDEKQKQQDFAKKITKVPETVRRYT